MFEEDRAFFEVGVAVVENLRQERVEPQERSHVGLEQPECVEFVLSGFDGFVVVGGLGGLQRGQ